MARIVEEDADREGAPFPARVTGDAGQAVASLADRQQQEGMSSGDLASAPNANNEARPGDVASADSKEAAASSDGKEDDIRAHEHEG